MGVATFERSDLDLFSLEVMADPYPHFAQLRERASVVWLEKLSAFAITRYEPIREVLGDWEHFSSKRVAFNDTWNDVLKGTSLTADPPEHTALRAALTENLSPRALRGMNERIDQQADEIVAGLVGARLVRCDQRLGAGSAAGRRGRLDWRPGRDARKAAGLGRASL